MAKTMREDPEMFLLWVQGNERRRYLAMSPEKQKEYREAPLPPDLQAKVDDFREGLLDDMPNITPRTAT